MDTFAACVRAKDFAGGRGLFSKRAQGFGTVARTAVGIATLERRQWAKVWPRTSGFHFERKGSRIEQSEDGSLAVVMARWKACNQAAPKRLVYDRRGRATIVLLRAQNPAGWVAIHSHFSFDPSPSKASSSSR